MADRPDYRKVQSKKDMAENRSLERHKNADGSYRKELSKLVKAVEKQAASLTTDREKAVLLEQFLFVKRSLEKEYDV